MTCAVCAVCHEEFPGYCVYGGPFTYVQVSPESDANLVDVAK